MTYETNIFPFQEIQCEDIVPRILNDSRRLSSFKDPEGSYECDVTRNKNLTAFNMTMFGDNNVTISDDYTGPAWYRFNGSAGNRMAEMFVPFG